MMPGYRLWLMVEGSDDELFADAVLAPEFRRAYHAVQIWQYSQVPIERRANFLRSIDATPGEDYILFCDIDEHPCVTSKKEWVKSRLTWLPDDKIAVVVSEIESWYLAGLSQSDCQDLNLGNVSRPDEMVKESFDARIGGKINHTAMMREILNRYDLSEARRRSPSFGYFAGKHLPDSASG